VLEHYFSVAWLNLRRHPLAAVINVLTLALGLVCFILAFAITGFWSRAEQHFANANRTVVITSEWRLRDGSETSSGVALPLTNHELARYLEVDFPQVEATARVIQLSATTPVTVGDRALRLRAFAADAPFLEIFDLPFVAGDARSALRAPRSVILTRDAARALYGRTDVVGRSITLYGTIDATVTGVIERIKDPSHMGQSAGAPLQFDALTSRDIYEALTRAFTGGRDTTQLPAYWLGGDNTTYALLPKDGSFTREMLNAQLPGFIERHVPDGQRRRAQIEFEAVPVSALLGMAVRDALFPRERAVSVHMLLLALGAIVLLVACVNFANLATARAAGRARETGVRKAIGARPRQVMGQYLLEAGMLTGSALVIALALVGLLMPILERNAGIDLAALLSADVATLAVPFMLALTACVTLAAGFYPAFILSRVQPALAVRASQTQSGPRSLTGVLVGVQFAFAAFLLIAVSIVHEQNEALKRAGNDIAGNSLVVIDNPQQLTGLSQATLRQELLRLPGVVAVTAMETRPWTNIFTRMPLASSPGASAVERTALVYVVGHDFFKAFDIELLAGRVFDDRAEDLEIAGPQPVRTQHIVITTKLARELGFDSPSAAVDQMIYIPVSVTGETAARPFRIIGVVADKSLTIASRFGARPNLYLFNPERQFQIVRIDEKHVAAVLAAIDATWTRLVPGFAPSRRFVADDFGNSYASFARVNQTFTALALIAWLISTIGLYAMAILVSGRRVREIAIRKTLGAQTGQVVRLLLRSFTTPVLMANVIAWPFAYIAGRAYLDVFIDPVALTPWPFIVSLIVSLAIAWLAVGGQTWRAANAAPARVMRQEN
jgi:putative ABC transport system permease protein